VQASHTYLVLDNPVASVNRSTLEGTIQQRTLSHLYQGICSSAFLIYPAIFKAPTPQNQATSWTIPCSASLPTEPSTFPQDIVPLCAFSGGMLAMHVARIHDSFP
jgi:hypothetical protein